MRNDLVPDSHWFQAERPPWGPANRRILVAGRDVMLEGLDERIFGVFGDQFPPEARVPAGEGPPIRVLVRKAGVEHFLCYEPGEDCRHEVRLEGQNVLTWSYGFAGRISQSERRADLFLAGGPDWMLRTSVVNFLRVLYSWIAFDTGGFLLHSSAIVREGRAWVFFGPSGIGKTTVARLSEPHPVLNDDLLLISEKDGVYYAGGLPLSGEFRGVDAATGTRVPIAALHRLVQDTEVRREPLPRPQAVAEVLASIPYTQVRLPGETLIDRVTGLVRQAPAYRLHFRRDPSFWEAVLAPAMER